MKSAPRLSCMAVALIAAALIGGCGSAQSRKARYIEHGQQYLAAGNYDKARVELRNALQIDPRDGTVRLLLGQVAERTGDVREALGQYQAAIAANSQLAEARAALGRLFLLGGLPDKAMELAEAGLTDDPKNVRLLTVRGAARAQLGESEAALSDATTAVQLAPDDDYAIALLGSLYKRRGDIDKAIAVVEAGSNRLPKNVDLRVILADLYLARQRYTDAEAQLRQTVALEPGALVDRYRLARFYLLQKQPDAAEQTLRDAVAALPDNLDAKLQLVQFLAAQRGRDAAAAQVDKFIADHPNDDALQLGFAQLLAQAGMTDRAAGMFRNIIARSGDKPEGLTARNRLAGLLLAGHDVAGAQSLIAEVLKRNPRDNDALTLHADVALAAGDPASAIADLRAVLRDQPTSVPLMRALARAYEQNHEPDLAEEMLRNAVQTAPKDELSRLELAQVLTAANRLDEASGLLEQLAKESPLNIGVQQALFRVQAAQKHFVEARATAAAIEQARPDLGVGYYLAGLVDEADSKPADAEHDYESALQKQPGAGEPLAAIVRLEVRRKDNARARQFIDAALAAGPDNAVAYNLKGELLLADRQTDAAVAAFQAAAKTAPGWEEPYHGLAIAQLAAHRNDDAIRSLQQGIEATRGGSALVGYLAGLYQRLGRIDDAIAVYDNALARNPKSWFAANNLAMLLVTYKTDTASLARARKLADQLASLSVVDVVDTRGWVMFKSGDFRAAESLLQQAVDKSPDSPQMRYHLGMAQLRGGEPQAAEHNLESALRSNQPFEGADEARSVLAQLKKADSAG